jgi:hypothetical protein
MCYRCHRNLIIYVPLVHGIVHQFGFAHAPMVLPSIVSVSVGRVVMNGGVLHGVSLLK